MRCLPFFLLVCMGCSTTAFGDDEVGRRWHELRILGYLVTSSVLVHFNDVEDTPDPGRPSRYQQDLGRMYALAQELKSAKAKRLVSTMDGEIRALEAMPRKGVNRYGHGLEQLLKIQEQLNAEASTAYELLADSIDPAKRELQAASLDMGQLLQIYQVRTFREVPRHSIDVSDDRVSGLDNEISSNLDSLVTEKPEMETQIVSAKRSYFFVREKLLNPHHIWTPSGVDLFLGRSIRELDHLAQGEPEDG